MNLKKRYLFVCPFVIIMFTVLVKIRGPSDSSSIEGWDRNTSKNIRDYISETLRPHIIPGDFCSQKGLLLVMVHSKPSNFEARSAIRDTWGQKRANVSFFFLLGEVKNDLALQFKLELESTHYGDMIQERFVDHYNNLTLKSVAMLKLFNSHCFGSFKYLMKTDDDVFLNTDLVVSMLSQRSTSTDLLLGKVVNDTSPFRDTSSKWFVPYELYPADKYPDYLCGPAYLMSADVVQKLYECALETPIFFIEDTYVTGICAKKMQVVPQHDPLFTCRYVGNICTSKDLYNVHYYTPEDIRNAYAILKNEQCFPKLRWRDWLLFFKII